MTTMQQTEQKTAHSTEIALHRAEIALDETTAALNMARVAQHISPQAYADAITAQEIAVNNYKDAIDASNAYHRSISGLNGEAKRRNQRSSELPRSGNN